jgi:hypothetical protein
MGKDDPYFLCHCATRYTGFATEKVSFATQEREEEIQIIH